jgi:hypothetical protein
MLVGAEASSTTSCVGVEPDEDADERDDDEDEIDESDDEEVVDEVVDDVVEVDGLLTSYAATPATTIRRIITTATTAREIALRLLYNDREVPE